MWTRQLQRGTMTSNLIVSSQFLLHLIRIYLNFSNHTLFDKKNLEKCSKFDVFILFFHFFTFNFKKLYFIQIFNPQFYLNFSQHKLELKSFHLRPSTSKLIPYNLTWSHFGKQCVWYHITCVSLPRGTLYLELCSDSLVFFD